MELTAHPPRGIQFLVNKNISPEILTAMTKSLNQARLAHVQWVNDLNKQVIFKVPMESFTRDHMEECELGKWLSLVRLNSTVEDENYNKLVVVHIDLHEQANRLLDVSLSGNSIAIKDYERFVATVGSVMQYIENIQESLVSYNLCIDNLTQ